MKISTKGRYALRYMVDLAQHPQESVSLKESAQRLDVSMKYLEQIVALLVKQALVNGSRGAKGGYRLTKEPYQYSAFDIIEVMEGSLSPVPCLDNDPIGCEKADDCPTIHLYQKLKHSIESVLKTTTLSDLCDSPGVMVGALT
ncbi:MAG: Rrf2 family transcriptional regulator [Sphaerochaetaceae bacterium]|jgi:Rrf2 family protein|nr:Rrf2 family transcriptional regulator [Sphaerochaetaceae bacterium]MDD2406659.1 Rrf2 family transcriptional regulator [Sphaerochaetaceae bacterium]MDD3670974.1 Rrf2 family transcriptional regulator [Sphaerochaetaceae bacterium]MDD4259780.1 Rrf2 family transcriptional regulator [Sphaerochaetaceae bacterium]MDD4763433.1 Rrf2 family transcriptional regulator [Sphaerochaetaceae bacterium]